MESEDRYTVLATLNVFCFFQEKLDNMVFVIYINYDNNARRLILLGMNYPAAR
jgi:hypothetical protein